MLNVPTWGKPKKILRDSMPVLYPQPAYGAFPESMIFSRQTKRGKLLQRAPSCPSDSRQIRQQDRRRETSLYTYRITAGTTKIGIFRFDTLSRHAAPPLPARQACVVPQAQVERPGVWVNTDKILELTPDPIHLRKIFCQTQPMNKVPTMVIFPVFHPIRAALENRESRFRCGTA